MIITINENQLKKFIAAEGLSVSPDASREEIEAIAMKIANAKSSQAKAAAFLINITEGNITNDELTATLAAWFPNAKVGDRHGAHFASLSRSGKLKGCRFEVAKAGRTSSKIKNELADLRALIESVKDAKNIKDVREAINEFENPTAE